MTAQPRDVIAANTIHFITTQISRELDQALRHLEQLGGELANPATNDALQAAARAVHTAVNEAQILVDVYNDDSDLEMTR